MSRIVLLDVSDVCEKICTYYFWIDINYVILTYTTPFQCLWLRLLIFSLMLSIAAFI